MLKLRYVPIVIIAASVTLAGCSGPSSEESATTSPTTAAADPSTAAADPSTAAADPSTTAASAPAEETSDPEGESSEPAAAASELTAAAATGNTFEGTGYSFTGPEGWEELTEGIADAGVDIFVADTDDTDGFADNINVVLSPAGAVTPDLVESAGLAELEAAGDFEVAVKDRVMVAGAESAHLSAAATSEEADYQIEQFYVTPADQTFVVTFSFSPSVPETERNEIAHSVLVTWS